jgi:RNA polymerase sigma-70 factor (ECF subfamily)
MSAVDMMMGNADWIAWLADPHDGEPRDGASGDASRADRARPAASVGPIVRGRRVLLSDADAAALVARIAQGDEQAFGAIYREFYRFLWEFAYSLVGSGDVAEDIVQDVFATWWARRATVVIHTGIDPYLYSSVRYRALNWRRSARGTTREDVAATMAVEHVGLSQPTPRPDEQASIHDFEAALIRAIAALPPLRRTAVTLRVRHGLEYTEIAEVMGISAEAVMIHVSRARAILRRVLQAYYPS